MLWPWAMWGGHVNAYVSRLWAMHPSRCSLIFLTASEAWERSCRCGCSHYETWSSDVQIWTALFCIQTAMSMQTALDARTALSKNVPL